MKKAKIKSTLSGTLIRSLSHFTSSILFSSSVRWIFLRSFCSIPSCKISRNNFAVFADHFCHFDRKESGTTSDIKNRHSFFDILGKDCLWIMQPPPEYRFRCLRLCMFSKKRDTSSGPKMTGSVMAFRRPRCTGSSMPFREWRCRESATHKRVGCMWPRKLYYLESSIINTCGSPRAQALLEICQNASRIWRHDSNRFFEY